MNLHKTIKRKGVTLIELVVVIALIGIVISVVFSMFFFGRNTFSRGENQYDLQTEGRFAIESLSQDLRFVREIEIVDDFSVASPDPYETMLYYDSANNQIVKSFAGITTVYELNTSSVSPLVFKKSSSNRLHYMLTGEDSGQNFTVQSDITLLNVSDIDVSALTDTVNLTGEAILFTTPEAYLAQTLSPTVTLPTPNANTATHVELIYNQPVTAYLDTYDVIIESDPLNATPLEAADVSIARSTVGLESVLSLDIDLSGVVVLNGERIVVTIYDSVDVDSEGDPIPQHIVMLSYNDSTTHWDPQN